MLAALAIVFSPAVEAGVIRRAVPWVLRVLLTIGFLLPGITKFSPRFGWVERFAGWGYSAWFVAVIGAIEQPFMQMTIWKRERVFGAFAAITMLPRLLAGRSLTDTLLIEDGRSGNVVMAPATELHR